MNLVRQFFRRAVHSRAQVSSAPPAPALPTQPQTLCALQRLETAIGLRLPEFDMRFLMQISGSGTIDGVPFVRLRNNDILFGATNWRDCYYKPIFEEFGEYFNAIGLSEEAYGAAFDGLRSYQYENCAGSHLMKTSFLPYGGVMLDIGVRDGIFSVKSSRFAGDRGHIYCIDPTDLSERMVGMHARANSISNLTFIKAAVGDTDGIDRDFVTGSAGEQYSGFFPTVIDESGRRVIDETMHCGAMRVRQRTIDAIVDDLDLTRCDVIVLQINGAECLALAGAVQTLRRFRPVVLMAAFVGPPPWQDPVTQAAEIVAPLGYEIAHKMCDTLVLAPK